MQNEYIVVKNNILEISEKLKKLGCAYRDSDCLWIYAGKISDNSFKKIRLLGCLVYPSDFERQCAIIQDVLSSYTFDDDF